MARARVRSDRPRRRALQPIISDLLEFSSKRNLNRRPTRLDDWLRETLAQQSIPADIVLEQILQANDEVEIDRERLRQVIVNLVQNAVQALKDPGWHPDKEHPRRIAVRTEATVLHIRISVADNGPGIPSDVLPHIFEPLFTTKGFGVGLGLPITRQIVEQHDGRIDVATAAREGTIFTIVLPRRSSALGPRPPGSTSEG